MRKILVLIGILIVFFTGFILVRTLIFTKSIPSTKALSIPVLSDSSIKHLSQAIQIKTISNANPDSIDVTEFLKFQSFLDTSYPLINHVLDKTIINDYSCIYRWKGKNSSLNPFLFLAHLDIVPVENSSLTLWNVAPFGGTIKDNAVWGRGAIDDKGSLIAIMEATEHLLHQQYQPERDIYLCFGHDEELGGEKGAKEIVKWFEQKNIHPALVMDEGGIITKDNFKELNRPIALLGVTEKGHVSYKLSVEVRGGHSSMPEKETAIDILSKALVKIREKQMPVHITLPTNIMLEKIGPGLGFATRMALANRWLFEGMLASTFEKKNTTNASIHTTIVPTIISSGIKENVIPSVAEATVNSRIMPGETSVDVYEFIKKQINDTRVKITKLPFSSEPGKLTPMDGEAYKLEESTVYKLLDDVVVTPFLMIGATDGRYYNRISDAVIRFIPAIDPHGFHGIDERMTFKDFGRMIFFYELMMKGGNKL